MKQGEHDFFAILTLLVIGAIIADFLSNGKITQGLLTTVAQFLNSGLSIASGGNAKTVK